MNSKNKEQRRPQLLGWDMDRGWDMAGVGTGTRSKMGRSNLCYFWGKGGEKAPPVARRNGDEATDLAHLKISDLGIVDL